MDFAHGMAEIEPGLRLHYVTAGEGERTIVLVHGFPQTWFEWRRVIGGLTAAGFRVVAPDYRGAGHSWRPVAGYDKQTMAADLNYAPLPAEVVQLVRGRLETLKAVGKTIASN